MPLLKVKSSRAYCVCFCELGEVILHMIQAQPGSDKWKGRRNTISVSPSVLCATNSALRLNGESKLKEIAGVEERGGWAVQVSVKRPKKEVGKGEEKRCRWKMGRERKDLKFIVVRGAESTRKAADYFFYPLLSVLGLSLLLNWYVLDSQQPPPAPAGEPF